MSRIVNPYTIPPNDLEPGDVMVCTVTLHVGGNGTYSMYQCKFTEMYGLENEIPQGGRLVGDVETVARNLFPVAVNAGLEAA